MIPAGNSAEAEPRGSTFRPYPDPMEAEQALLGALLIDPGAWAAVEAELPAAAFHLAAHRHIFEAISDLMAEGKPIDPVLVNARLDTAGHLGTEVPRELVFGLAAGVGVVGNVVYYAQQVAEMHEQRGGMALALPTARITLADVLAPPVETMLLGNTLPRGKVSVFYGPSGVGKTAVVAQIAFSLAAGEGQLWGLRLHEGGGHVLVYSLEDSLDDWRLKAAAIHKAGGIQVEPALARLHIIDKTEGTARLSEVVTTREDNAGGHTMRRRALPTEERDRLIATARKLGAILLVVETASRLVDDEDNAHFSALQSDLGYVARSTRAAVLLTHHSTKAAVKDNDQALESARGGGALVYNARNALALFPAETKDAGPYCDRWPATDIFILHHMKTTSSTRKQAPITLVRCDGTFGGVFHRPGDVQASPEQARATAARIEQEQLREMEALGRLFDLVERTLPTRPTISPSWLRDNCHSDLGLPKHGVGALVRRALDLGYLREKSSNERGLAVTLGRDPRQAVNARPCSRADSGE